MCVTRTSRLAFAGKRVPLCIFLLSILRSLPLSGASISLSWNPSPSANIAGYLVFYGEASGNYTSSADVGTNTTATLSGLTPGQTYYFATAAYNSFGLLSPFSNEVTNTFLLLPTPPTAPTPPAVPTVPTGPTPPVQTPPTGLTLPGTPTLPGGLSLPEMRASALPLSSNNQTTSQAHKLISATAATSGNADAPVGTPTPPLPAGVYNGLFYRMDAAGTPALNLPACGFLANCVIKTNGQFSARLACAGGVYPLSGTIAAGGDASSFVSRHDAGLPNLKVILHLATDPDTGKLTGAVSNMDAADPWVAAMDACRATNAFAPAAQLQFLFPAPAGGFEATPKERSLRIRIASNGVVSLLGNLGDGAAVSQSVPISSDGSFPIYISLYHQAGLLAGMAHFAEGSLSGDLVWIGVFDPASGPANSRRFTRYLSFVRSEGLSSTILRLNR